GELSEAIEAARRGDLGVDEFLGGPGVDLAGEMDLESGAVQERDGTDAALALEKALPVGLDVRGERIDRAQSGGNDPTRHCSLLGSFDDEVGRSPLTARTRYCFLPSSLTM